MHTRNPGFIAGDYWLVCERCGFDYRFSQMKKEWTGVWVCSKCWEPRHPQDFVRAVRDEQRVPVARPASIISNLTTTLSSAASKGAKSIVVASASNIADKDTIGVVLQSFDEDWDSASELVQWTYVNGDPSGTTITLADGLWEDAASGNIVRLGQVTGPTITTPTGVSADDL